MYDIIVFENPRFVSSHENNNLGVFKKKNTTLVRFATTQLLESLHSGDRFRKPENTFYVWNGMLQGKFGRLESFAVSFSDWSRRIFEDMYLSINMKNITSEKFLIS